MYLIPALGTVKNGDTRFTALNVDDPTLSKKIKYGMIQIQ